MTSDQRLTELYKKWSGNPPERVEPLPGSGSYRRYYRFFGKRESVVGAINEDDRENQAFISFSKHFREEGLPVPDVLAGDRDGRCYLLTDLGDETLFERLTRKREGNEQFPGELTALYKKVIGWLPQFQVIGGRGLDYSKCYPRAAFDEQSMMWDLNYFKYYFLKLARIPFDEQKLEDDFTILVSSLLEAGRDHFMYRDFQSRNVMIVKDEPWFIDFQGGRKGALQYDVASLLYDAKANIPLDTREVLLEHYMDVLNSILPVDRQRFTGQFYGFVLIRILQALGAYGFRGYYEKKSHFLQSIPFAMKNLEFLLTTGKINLKIPTLLKLLGQMAGEERFRETLQPATDLLVSVTSFSYRNGIPEDHSGNGGGFVFDCRALPNPGRYEEYKSLTGKDAPVVEFLKREQEVDRFLEQVFGIVGQSISVYTLRGFTHLAVNFGCTGGQHRSVFCAEALASHIRTHFGVKVEVSHREIDR